MKKITAIFAALGIIWLTCVSLFAADVVDLEEEYPVIKKGIFNVARDKKVTLAHAFASTPYVSRINDGDTAFDTTNGAYNAMGSYGGEYAWFQIDLVNRYEVEYVVLYSLNVGVKDSIKSNFQIVGSNDEDFTNGVVLFDASECDYSQEWADGMGFRLDIPAEKRKACRYIRYQKTKLGVSCGLAEFEAYAFQTLTDVARGKSASANAQYNTLSAANVLNGTNKNENDCWYAPSTTNAYDWICVNLESKYPIDKIEAESRNIKNDTTNFRKNMNLYASTVEIPSEVLNADKANLDISDDYDYVNFFRFCSGSSRLDNFPPYDANVSSCAEKYICGRYGIAAATDTAERVFDRANVYQYITLRRTVKGQAAAIGALRVYTENPVLLSVGKSGNNIYLSFSQPMKEETLNTKTISLSDTEGKSIPFTVSGVDDYTYRLDIGEVNMNSATLSFGENVFNCYGVPLVIHNRDILRITNSVDVLSVDFTLEGEKTERLLTDTSYQAHITLKNNTDTDEKISVFAALKSGEALVDTYNAFVFSKSYESAVCTVDFDTVSGYADYKLLLYVWNENLVPLYCLEKNIYEYEMQYNYYVSAKLGNDSNTGSFAEPFATVEAAKKAVAAESAGMDGDIHIYIMGGTYYLDNTLTFGVEDSGQNGYNVIYQAYEDDEVIISGGRELKMSQTADGLWKSEPTGIEYIGELYVENRKAKRAGMANPIEISAIYSDEDDSYARDGIMVDTGDLPLNFDYSNSQLHFIRGWKDYLLNIKKVENRADKTILYLQQPHFENVSDPSANHPVNEDSCFYIENDRASLDEDGEFFFDKVTTEVYYKPCNGESLVKTEVIVPRLEKIADIAGDNTASKVHNIVFKNLTFAHSAWYQPGEDGFVTGQTAQMYTYGTVSGDREPGISIVPANIQLNCAENVVFENNIIKYMAGVGIGMYNGVSNCSIRGNVFEDIADCALTVGLPEHDYIYENIYGTGRDLAAGRMSVAACSDSGGTSMYYANDSVNKRAWSPDTVTDTDEYVNGEYKNGHKHWWMIDLGEPYEIDRIEIDAWRTSDQAITRRNFAVYGANAPDFSDSVLLAEQGKTAFDAGNTAVYTVMDANKYRYIKAEKTIAEYFVISDIRIINESMTYTAPEEVCSRISVTNNYITRAGNGHYGASGIQTFYTQNMNISHNELCDLPYSGICLGWGWTNTPDSDTAHDNKVNGNYIHHYSQRAIDAGGIYTLGNQPGSQLIGNYITDQKNVYAGIYLDAGSQYYRLENNVIDRTLASYMPGRLPNTLLNNYMTSVPSVISGITFPDDAMIYYDPAAPNGIVRSVTQSAGLEEPYRSVKDKSTSNPYPAESDEIYCNVLHETQYGVMHDERFVHLYLKVPLDAAARRLSAAKASGIYPSSAVNGLEETIAAADAVRLETPIDRKKVIAAKEMLDTAVAELEASANKP